MRIQHIENALKKFAYKEFFRDAGPFQTPIGNIAMVSVAWKVRTVGTRLPCLMIDCSKCSKETAGVREAASRVWARCRELYSYLANNWAALTNFGWRHRNGFPISTSPTEVCVDDIGNTLMGKLSLGS